MKELTGALSVFAVLALFVTANSLAARMDGHTMSKFEGPKANTDSFRIKAGKYVANEQASLLR